jgi:hypothetical protein
MGTSPFIAFPSTPFFAFTPLRVRGLKFLGGNDAILVGVHPLQDPFNPVLRGSKKLVRRDISVTILVNFLESRLPTMPLATSLTGTSKSGARTNSDANRGFHEKSSYSIHLILHIFRGYAPDMIPGGAFLSAKRFVP